MREGVRLGWAAGRGHYAAGRGGRRFGCLPEACAGREGAAGCTFSGCEQYLISLGDTKKAAMCRLGHRLSKCAARRDGKRPELGR